MKNDEMLGTVISNSIAQAEGIFNIAYSKATNGDLSDVEGLEGKYIKTKHIKIDKNNVDVYLKWKNDNLRILIIILYVIWYNYFYNGLGGIIWRFLKMF